jgi:serine/threonine protein kinase
MSLLSSPKNNNSDHTKWQQAVSTIPFQRAASVYSHDPDSTGIYALKSMDKSLIAQCKKTDYVMNEQEIMESLDHPFIMKIHYSFTTKNYLNLVLDFCPGGELFFHIVKMKRLKENVAKFYIAEIILAIEHLHDNDILYRDLKPENVLIDYDGHIKLTDFGLSAMGFTRYSKSKVFCGSPEYMTPEMILKDNYTRMIDYYAIGALLYEMIGGIPPFYSNKRKVLFDNIINKEIKFYKEFSSKARDLIKKLLAKDPNERMGSTNGMQEVKNHAFFHEVDWDLLYDKNIVPPYKPSMRQKNFSEEFTSIPVHFNFEEEVTKIKRKMSANKFPDKNSYASQTATTFGEVAGFIMKNTYDHRDNFDIDLGRKNSEPPLIRMSTSNNFTKLFAAKTNNLIDSTDTSISDGTELDIKPMSSTKISKFLLIKLF